ncbi:MAG: DUF4838 domain-containing protein [Clostridia bacterium]|nr:DUF4838 domain-containing protein [Clostridia bacterium]
MAFFKAVISFLEILLLSIGIIPVKTDNIDYGGEKYTPPAVVNEMYIVEDGDSDYKIVIAENASETINTAANELQTYIEKISGAKLGIVADNDIEAQEKAILVGETALEDAIVDIDRNSIKADGFRLYADGTHLIIAGADERGTLYGAYTLLEEYFGVRWFTPTLERVPESEDLVIDANLDRTVEPSFAIRRNDCAGTNDAHRARTKMNVSFWQEAKAHGGALTYVFWDASLPSLVPDSLFAEHPEYFALQPDGTRSTDHVCLSNPEVLEVAVASARQQMRDCPRETSDHVHIGQKDNSNYCRCESCEELYERYGSICAPTLIFTNNFADALDDEFPNFTFTFYAYLETDKPPQDLSLRCNPNVAPVLCGLHGACRSHPLTECGHYDIQEETFMTMFGDYETTIAEDFKNWTKVADTTYIYDYTINFLNSAQFFSNLGTLQSTMKYMHDIGITGYVYNCGDGHYAAFNELRNYLLCKVQWDVNADVEYHMIDFLNEYYGEAAAPYIKEILDIQTAQIAATAHSFDFDWHYQSGYYPISKINKLDRLWEKALKADVTDEQMFNIEVAKLSWEYFKANQFLGKYFFLNPLRLKANEDLYDAFKEHGMNRVSSFGTIPENKEDVDFMLRPFNWK